MNISDVMTRDVATIDAGWPVRDIAQLLLERHLGAVPVVDDAGQLIGLVSESDLLRRVETGTERRRAGWRALINTGAHLAADYAKAHGRCAGDIMSRTLVTADEDTPLTRVIDLLDSNKIKCVPIVRGGAVVGIISRTDILRTLLGAKPEDLRHGAVDDAKILAQLQAELRDRKWARSTGVHISVKDGVVELSGSILSDAERTALRIAAERIPGVRKVEDRMTPVEARPGM